MYNKELLINDVPPLTTVLFDELRSTITVPDCRDINLAVFKKDTVEHFKNTTVNKLTGFDAFPQHDIIAGCQQYVDNLISKYVNRDIGKLAEDARFYGGVIGASLIVQQVSA